MNSMPFVTRSFLSEVVWLIRHTQSNEVWEPCRVMSRCGAIEGVAVLHEWTDKLERVFLVECSRSHNPEQTAIYFHSARTIQLHTSTPSLPPSLSVACAFLQQFEARPWGEAASSTEESELKRKKLRRNYNAQPWRTKWGKEEEIRPRLVRSPRGVSFVLLFLCVELFLFPLPRFFIWCLPRWRVSTALLLWTWLVLCFSFAIFSICSPL